MKVKRTGNTLAITVELDPDGWASSTGKMRLHYTSGGFTSVPIPDVEGARVNLTIGVKV